MQERDGQKMNSLCLANSVPTMCFVNTLKSVACRGWRLAEVAGEIGGSAGGPSGKAAVKFVNEKAAKPEPSQEFTAAYAYEPSFHLLNDQPPSIFRPVSMVLFRNGDATQLCDPSGRELGKCLINVYTCGLSVELETRQISGPIS